MPTTLPTLDELLGRTIDGVMITTDNIAAHLLKLTAGAARDHVYTLHAELEGQKLAPIFEQLLTGWKAQGYQLASMADYYQKVKDHASARLSGQLGRSAGPVGRADRAGSDPVTLQRAQGEPVADSHLAASVPDFSAAMTGDEPFQLAGRPARYTVLYFYPKDNTPGCTTESIAFRELYRQFQQPAPRSSASAAIRCARTKASRPSWDCRSS